MDVVPFPADFFAAILNGRASINRAGFLGSAKPVRHRIAEPQTLCFPYQAVSLLTEPSLLGRQPRFAGYLTAVYD